jgi:transcriptional regulator with XRE-family HTH domain
MTPNEIKSLMILKGIKQTDIATKLSIRKSSVSNTISGRRSTPRIRKAVAEALGEDYLKLWGVPK